jgi:hypothetical protein
MRAIGSVPIVLLVLAACSDGQGTAAGSGGSELMAGDRSIRFVEELRIDGYESDLVPIHTAVPRPGGGIVIAQRQDSKVRLFDAAGTPVRDFGGAGEGPGEFRDVTRLGHVGGTLWVLDFRLRRFTLIDASGAHVRTTPIPQPGDSSGLPGIGTVPFALYADGSTVGLGSMGGESAIVRVSADDGPGQILTLLSVQGRSQGVRAGGGTASPPFPNAAQWTVSPGGAAIAIARAVIDGPEAGRFSVTAMRPDGDTIYTRDYPFDLVPIPESVADSTVEARLEALPFPPELAKAFREAPIPEFFPPLRELIIGDDGMVWVRFRDTETGRPYRVIDPAGEPLGDVVLDLSRTVVAADGSTVWMLERDENDVQSVIRFRLQSAIGEPSGAAVPVPPAASDTVAS